MHCPSLARDFETVTKENPELDIGEYPRSGVGAGSRIRSRLHPERNVVPVHRRVRRAAASIGVVNLAWRAFPYFAYQHDRLLQRRVERW